MGNLIKITAILASFLLINHSKAELIYLDCFDLIIDTTNKKIWGNGNPNPEDAWDLEITPNDYLGYLPEFQSETMKKYDMPPLERKLTFGIDRKTLKYWEKSGGTGLQCNVLKKKNLI